MSDTNAARVFPPHIPAARIPPCSLGAPHAAACCRQEEEQNARRPCHGALMVVHAENFRP